MRMNRNSHFYLALEAKRKLSAVVCSFALLVGIFFFTTNDSLAQGIRRQAKVQQRIQKKLDKQGANKLTPNDDSTSAAPKPSETTVKQDAAPAQQPSNLDGIRERGILSMFSREEAQMVIQGFGRGPALLIVLRQLNLTPEQKGKIRALRIRIGNRLGVAQRERAMLEQQVEDAIYGENFSIEKVDELAAQVAEKQGEIIKLQASIEAQFRQILTPDQFYVFQFLIGEIVLPQRRLTPQQQQRRFGNPQNPLNRQNRPPLNQDN